MESPQYFTISRIRGKYDSNFDGSKKVVFYTNETGEKELSCLTKFPDQMDEGKKIYGHVETRESNGRMFHNFKWDKDPNGGAKRGGMGLEQVQGIMRELHAINTNVLRVWEQVRPDKGLTSAGQKVPDFSEVDERMAEIQEAKAARDNADEQFGDPWGGMEVRESD